jgi:hypothetical protein
MSRRHAPIRDASSASIARTIEAGNDPLPGDACSSTTAVKNEAVGSAAKLARILQQRGFPIGTVGAPPGTGV